jgi:glycosyltransferase involved in cell wall biosynthesis
LNILIGVHGYPPEQGGGAEWRGHRMATWFSRQGHRVQVLAVKHVGTAPEQDGMPEAAHARTIGDYELTDEQAGAVRIRRLSYSLDQARGSVAEFNNPIARHVMTDLLAEAQRDDRPVDVFHLISGYRLTASAIAAAQAAHVPVVVTLTDFWFLCPRIVLIWPDGRTCPVPTDPLDCALCLLENKRRYRLLAKFTHGASRHLLRGYLRRAASNAALIERREFLGRALRSVDAIIAPSHFLAQLFKAQGIPAEKMTIIRQGVGVGAPAHEEPASALQPIAGSLGDDEPAPLIFGYVGRMDRLKGVEILVRAFRQLPYGPDRIRLAIHADPAQAWPDYWQRVQDAIAGDPRIMMAGPFAHPDAPRIYRSFAALVVPSTWYENSPNVILEAFACGVPVIASDLGGMAELVRPGVNGALFRPGDVASLRDCLAAIVDHPEQLQQWRLGVPRTKTLAEEMEELEEVYYRAIAACQASP